MKKKNEKPSDVGPRGATRMRQNGYRQVSLWLDRAELNILLEAAAKRTRPLATYIREVASRQACLDCNKAPALFLSRDVSRYGETCS